LLPALAVALVWEAGGLAVYATTRPPHHPTLLIRLAGEGPGQVLVTRPGESAPFLRCSEPICAVDVPPGSHLMLSTVLGDDATFGGYHQLPMRTPAPLVGILGDPLAACTVTDATASGNVLDCPIVMTADTEIAVDFGLTPKEIDVALDVPPMPPSKIDPEKRKIDAEKLEAKPMEVALAPPKPPPMIKPPPPPPVEKPKDPQKKTDQPPPNEVMVEVKDDKHVVDKAPEDADKLSDKNRDVDVETRADKTNLDKESEGKEVASRENDDTTSTEIGGPDDRIRQLEETKATTDKHIKETDHSGKDETAKGVIQGNGGQNGQEGTGGDAKPGVLSMRGIEGRGGVTSAGSGGKEGKRGLPGVNSPLSFDDYERVMGKEKVDEERQVAARKMSSKKGKWEKKIAAIQSSLENFVPDVRVGNQTALKTRAHPFALFIARMHRRIHELWGFGFLEQLNDRGANDPLNNMDLWTNLEVSINPDGTLHKVTIAKTSGSTEFDVAAVDAVISAGPYEETPEAIRSVDGRVYLRWGFYRNWRQCGTFNAEPYILTSVPEDSGGGVLDDGAMVANIAKLPGKKKGNYAGKLEEQAATASKPVTPDDGLATQKVNPDSSVHDKQALFAADQWVASFTAASVEKLTKYSMVPFYANGKVAAETTGDLSDMYSGLVVESGPLKDWKLLTPQEYGGGLPEGNVVLQVRTAKESFAIVLTKTKSGEYRATQLAR
jgi:TonB family protein